MDGWCGFIIFLDRVKVRCRWNGRMGEFDRFYAELRGEERVLFIHEEYLIMQVHQIPYPYFPVVVFFSQSVRIHTNQIYIYIYILNILLT